ncbi:hypothetical protein YASMINEVIRUS_1600 [Yasminevirus sp. GU-2018]|uniref:Uncharacterized protein n=1 Tax=Yasminevirus sp. GU-2018 TaxID=2420051 RepID=A0A5K0UAL5_9VIRU|nr:hypothetical protein YASMINEVIRUS_1600 [Yasminevirus sp. GU-2018]
MLRKTYSDKPAEDVLQASKFHLEENRKCVKCTKLFESDQEINIPTQTYACILSQLCLHPVCNDCCASENAKIKKHVNDNEHFLFCQTCSHKIKGFVNLKNLKEDRYLKFLTVVETDIETVNKTTT